MILNLLLLKIDNGSQKLKIYIVIIFFTRINEWSGNI